MNSTLHSDHQIQSSDQDLSSSSLVLSKLFVLIILFVITITFTYLPLKLAFFKNNLKLIGIANAFSAGIFLAVALVHLLPESTELFNKLTKNTFPYSFFIAILGYSLILFVEKVLFAQDDDLDDNNEILKSDSDSDAEFVLNISSQKDIQSQDNLSLYLHSFKENETDKNEEHFKHFFSSTRRMSKMITTGRRSEENLINKQPLDNNHSHNSHEPHNITSYILLIAFSIHAIFEGIALGLQNEKYELFYLFIAISCHKWVEALTIGINFNQSKIDYHSVQKFILIFSVTTPFGIFLGILFSGRSLFLEAFFFAISSGTFIYISASEVVIEEFSVSKYKTGKFIGFLIGAFLIFLLSLFEEHDD